MISFSEHLTEKLKNPEFKTLYEEEKAALKREYQAAASTAGFTVDVPEACPAAAAG